MALIKRFRMLSMLLNQGVKYLLYLDFTETILLSSKIYINIYYYIFS